jgi:hypothetical protein
MGIRLTVTIRTQRRVAQMITKIPPLNRKINPAFFAGFRLECQSMGTGIDIKYKSVATLQDRKVQMTWLDTAGWHTS